MRVLSLGAGVQSSTLLLMAVHGEIVPTIDAAIFADTGWEPARVYEWLAFLELEASKAGIPIYRVSAGNLRDDALGGHSSAWMPLYILNADGSPGMLRRQCTKNYKIVPIRRQLRAMGFGHGNPVEQAIGISLDEFQRMRDSDVRFISNVYPLIDLRKTRLDCIAWLTSHGYPTPPKSACIGCPYHHDAYWREQKSHYPQEFTDAADFDARMRRFRFDYGDAFVHRSRVPLAEVDLSTPQDRGQLDMFGNECEGMCGV